MCPPPNCLVRRSRNIRGDVNTLSLLCEHRCYRAHRLAAQLEKVNDPLLRRERVQISPLGPGCDVLIRCQGIAMPIISMRRWTGQASPTAMDNECEHISSASIMFIHDSCNMSVSP